MCDNYYIEMLVLFGLVVCGEMIEESDIDLLVRFKENISFLDYVDNYFELFIELEVLVGCKVDFVF